MSKCLLAALISVGFVSLGMAQDLVFENNLVRLTIKEDASPQGLVEKATGKQWLMEKAGRVAWVRQKGAIHSATKMERVGEDVRLSYGKSGITTTQRISARGNYFVVELLDFQGENVDEICPMQLQANITQNAGGWLDVRWNEQFALAFVGLSPRVNTGGGRGIVYGEFGMKGEKIAVVAGPTGRLLDIVQEVEKDSLIPVSRINGQWAKRSADVKRGYFFVDLTQSNVDEVIRYAKLGGFLYVMTYSGTWSSSLGSYPINTKNFPDGEAGLKATIDKLHAAGLKAGMHMLTSFVGKNDPLVRPVPDKRLLKDMRATLAADIDETTNRIAAAEAVDQFPQEGAFYGDTKQGMDLLIDDEIVHYSRAGGADGRTFLQCTRGAHGTKKAPHKAGAVIHHLCERYGSYLVDLRSTLKDELAERVAGVVNRCGFDMIYFDGGECNMANGPYWYWAGPQQMAIWERFKRDVFVQGSGGTPWTWHIFARGACDDFASIGPKQYLDYHKIGDSWKHYTKSFMPAELGWWGFLSDAPHHPATNLDEVEFYAVRMMALDSPVSLETHMSALKQNGRTDELLELLGTYESMRLTGKIPASLREKFKAGEWRMAQGGEKPAFAPIKYDEQPVAAGEEVKFNNGFGAQGLKFRLQAAPTLAPSGDKANLALAAFDAPAALALPEKKTPMPGALAGSVDFRQAGSERFKGLAGARCELKRPINLLKHRALEVTLQVDSPAPAAQGCAVLNVQLQSPGNTYRDYYIDLDFAGKKTIVIPESNIQRMLPEFRPAHANYAFKAAMYGFNYGNIERLNFRWMRLPKEGGVKCAVVAVNAVAETESVLENPKLTFGGASLTIPVKLGTGDYVEWYGQGPMRVFDRTGKSLGEAAAPASVPRVPAGSAGIRLEAGAGRAKLTLITTGAAVSE